jgi:hypothetical protein
MSHSQFHSISLFILRHAWLNLWDKHMTTGRINQVTTFRPHTPGDVTPDIHNLLRAAFSVRSLSKGQSINLTATVKECFLRCDSIQSWQVKFIYILSCPPESHKFQTHLSLSSDKDRGLRKELPATAYNQSRRILKWLTQKHYIASPKSASSPPLFLHHIRKQQATEEVTGLGQLNKTVFKTLDCSNNPSIPR